MPNKRILLGHIAMLITTVIWGVAGAVIKHTLAYIPPVTFLFLRFLIVGIVLLPYLFIELQKTKINPKDYLNLFVLGIFSQTVLVLYFIGIDYTTVLDGTIIGISGSIASVYAGHYFFREKIDKRVTVGMVLASLGTLIVVLEPLLNPVKNHVSPTLRFWGNILVMCNTATWIFYIVWSKMSTGKERSSLLKKTLSFIHLRPMQKKYSPILLVALTFYVGLITICPLAILESFGFMGKIYTFNLFTLPTSAVFGLLYLSLLSSIIAYMLHQWGLERIKVSDSALYGYLGSVFSFPAAYFLLGEVPNKFMILGGVIIALGIFVAETKPLRK